MLHSRIATTLASLCLTVAMASSALAQPCDCSQSTLVGTTVGTLLNSDFHGPVSSTVIDPGIELPNAGPTLHAAGSAPRWNIDFGKNTIRIDFLQQPATYGAGSKFTFSSLNPIAPKGCPGTPYVAGVSVQTNKAGAASYVTPYASTPHEVVVPFAPAASSVDWNKGEYILVTLRFACAGDATPTPTPTASPTTFDPCCPPWNSSVLKNTMFYQGTGGISDPYTLKFTPTSVNAQMLAYLNYVKTLYPTITSMSVSFQLFGDGNGTSYSLGTPVVGGGPFLATWTTVPPSPNFFASGLMVVNKWYRVNTIIKLNGANGTTVQFFSDKCANSYIDVRIQVQASVRTLQTRFQDGRMIEQRISASGRAQ